MKKTGLIIVIGIILFISGCIPSLHPLYFDKDRITLDEIEGNWISDEDDGWEFVKDKNQPSYTLRITEDTTGLFRNSDIQTMFFEANIVKLGDTYFIDLYPGDNEEIENMADFLAIHLVPAHTFLKLEIVGDQLLIYYLSPDWLQNLIESHKIRIKHEVVDEDQIILTASTKELQKFITKYSHDEEAFSDPVILTLIN